MSNVNSERGRVEWIGVSGGYREPIQPRDAVRLDVGTGIDGDYHSKKKPGGDRQVTLIQAEHFVVIAANVGRTEPIPPDILRRNIVVSVMELTPLVGRRFRVGDAVLEGTGPCTPCSRMDENLGDGGRVAMKGLGGLTAKVIEAGHVRLGDAVEAT